MANHVSGAKAWITAQRGVRRQRGGVCPSREQDANMTTASRKNRGYGGYARLDSFYSEERVIFQHKSFGLDTKFVQGG